MKYRLRDSQAYFNFIDSTQGQSVLITLAILTILCLALGLTNSILICKRWRRITSQSTKEILKRNEALIGFYSFSLLNLALLFLYTLQVVRNLYNCEAIVAIAHLIYFIAPCIGYC